MTRLRTNMVGEQIAPLIVHVKVRVGITGGTNNYSELAATAVTQPARDELALVGILGFALLRVALFAKLFDPGADRIVVGIGDGFSDSSDISHGHLLNEISRRQRQRDPCYPTWCSPPGPKALT